MAGERVISRSFGVFCRGDHYDVVLDPAFLAWVASEIKAKKGAGG